MSDFTERDLELAREWRDSDASGLHDRDEWIANLAALLARVRREERAATRDELRGRLMAVFDLIEEVETVIGKGD